MRERERAPIFTPPEIRGHRHIWPRPIIRRRNGEWHAVGGRRELYIKAERFCARLNERST